MVTLSFKKLVAYGIGLKPGTYFKLMYISGNELVIAVFGMN